MTAPPIPSPEPIPRHHTPKRHPDSEIKTPCSLCSGFYTIDATSATPQLILGPFHGKPACQTIAFGRGVCGTAASSQASQLVADVEAFPGHIACDAESRSEVVVPITVPLDAAGASGAPAGRIYDAAAGQQQVETGTGRRLVGIIDVDCADVNGFDEVDRMYLEKLAELLGRCCDW